MNPHVVIHTTISLDNAFQGFDIDLEVHYKALLSFRPEAILAGSASALASIEGYPDGLLPEEAPDLRKPEEVPGDTRPIGVFVDSGGKLKDRLHFFRRLEHIRDVIVLVTDATPETYLDYLREREYGFVRCGSEQVDLAVAVHELYETFGISRVVSDSGSGLNGALIRQGVADEISLIVTPVIAGNKQRKLFESLDMPTNLELLRSETIEGGYMHLLYKILD